MTQLSCISIMKDGVEEKMLAKWKEEEMTKPWFISRILQVRYICYSSQELCNSKQQSPIFFQDQIYKLALCCWSYEKLEKWPKRQSRRFAKVREVLRWRGLVTKQIWSVQK